MAHDCDRFSEELMKCIDAFEVIFGPNPEIGPDILITTLKAVMSKNDETHAEQQNRTSTPKKSVKFNSTVEQSPKTSLDFNAIFNYVLKNSSIKTCGILKKSETSSIEPETKTRPGRKRKPISFYSEDEEVFICDSDSEESQDKLISQQIQNKKAKPRKLFSIVTRNKKRPPTKTKKNVKQLSQESETAGSSNNDHSQKMGPSNEDHPINSFIKNNPKTAEFETDTNRDCSTTTNLMIIQQENCTSTSKVDESTETTIKINEHFVMQNDTAPKVGNISVNETMNSEVLSLCRNWNDSNRKLYRNKQISNSKTVKDLVVIPAPVIPSTAHIDYYPMYK